MQIRITILAKGHVLIEKLHKKQEIKFLEKLGLTNATINFGDGSVVNIHETERIFQNIPKNTGITNFELLTVPCYHVDTI